MINYGFLHLFHIKATKFCTYFAYILRSNVGQTDRRQTRRPKQKALTFYFSFGMHSCHRFFTYFGAQFTGTEQDHKKLETCVYNVQNKMMLVALAVYAVHERDGQTASPGQRLGTYTALLRITWPKIQTNQFKKTLSG